MLQDSASRVLYGLRPAALHVGQSYLPARDMKLAGDAYLREHGRPVESYTFEVTSASPYIYRTQFDIGDVVTAVVPVMGERKLTTQITGITVSIGAGGVTRMDVEVGKPLPKDRLRRIHRRVQKVESRI